jgi:DNA-binding GntR family transcriptional regulator
MTGEPALSSSVQMAVLGRLRRDILRGTLAGNARLHQTELARAYGVSITPLREALRELAGEGLVDMNPFSGAVVHMPTLEELEDIYEIREQLIPLAVRKAVANVTSEELAQAERIVELMDDDDSPDLWVDQNRLLHHVLDDAARSKHLVAILRRLGDVSALYVNLTVSEQLHAPVTATAGGHRKLTLEEYRSDHRAILAAYRARDTDEAIRLSLDHIRHTIEDTRAVFSAPSDSAPSDVTAPAAERRT